MKARTRVAALAMTVIAAVAVLTAASAAALATEELARETATTCTACHDKPGSRLLTDRGKYFELMRTTDGFERVIENFGRCTYCHKSKPGSIRLTREGKRFEQMLGDMDALKAWLDAHHPKANDAGAGESAPDEPSKGERPD